MGKNDDHTEQFANVMTKVIVPLQTNIRRKDRFSSPDKTAVCLQWKGLVIVIS